MMGQLVAQHGTLASHIDRLANATIDLAKEMRGGFRNVERRFDDLRAEINERFDLARAESSERFRAAGARFDEIEERLARIEDGLRDSRADLLRLQNDLLNAHQSALEAHLRLDESASDEDGTP
jgi:septation ring formation regulator EzrA